MRNGDRLFDRRRLNRVLTSCLSADRCGRVLAERDGTVVWCNAAASAMLSGDGVLTLNAGGLNTVDRQQQAEFRQLLQQAQPAPRPVILTSAQGDALIVVAETVSIDDAEIVGLHLRPVREAGAVDLPALSKIYRLTGTAHAIGRGLLDGNTADEIAEQRRASTETIRTHIRKIYSKTGAKSREALFAKLLRYVRVACWSGVAIVTAVEMMPVGVLI